jgi:acyl-CoA synthetase (AMP-forming)/AMP-acid ligase II
MERETTSSPGEERSALLLRVSRAVGGGAIPPRDAGEADLPLTHAQRSAWFSCKLAGDSSVLNLPAAVRLRGALDLPALRAAIGDIVARHEILRTAFSEREGAPRQRVMPPGALDFSEVDCSLPGAEGALARAVAWAEEEARRPLELSRGQPFKTVLYRLGDGDHVLLVVAHHLVWDGWSIGLFVQELSVLYGARSAGLPPRLPPLGLQYGDVAVYEARALSASASAALLDAAEDELAGLGRVALPCDRPRAGAARFLGKMVFFGLSEAAGRGVTELARRLGATPFVVLLAAFSALLSRYGRDEGRPEGPFAVGTPLAHRERPETAALIGYFAQVSPIRVDPSGDPSFEELVARLRAATGAAHRRESLPFEVLVERLGGVRSADRNPLFDAMFALHSESLDRLSLGGVSLTPLELGSQVNHFDLGLHLWRRGETFAGYFSYASALFDPATVVRLAAQLTTLLEAALQSPETPLSRLPLLPAEERDWLLARGRGLALSPAVRERLLAGAAGALGDEALTVRGRAGELCPLGVRGQVFVGERATSALGAFRPSGELVLGGSLPGRAWAQGKLWDLDALEASLRAVPGVAGGWARLRSRGETSEVVVSVVLRRPVPREQLQAAAGEAHVLVVDHLPADGAELDGLPLLGEEARQEAESLARAAPGITSARAFFSPRTAEMPRVHASRLLADHALGRAISAHTTTELASRERPSLEASPRLAYADGGPLDVPAEAPKTLVEALLRAARGTTHAGLTLIEEDGSATTLSYATLLARASRVLAGLRSRGLRPGDRAILQVPSLAGHFVAFWGCVLGGIVPTTVALPPSYAEPSAVAWKLYNTAKLLGFPLVIAGADNVSTLAALPAVLRESGRFEVAPIEALEQSPPDSDYHAPRPEDVVFLQLTSGSTGVPKCIQETHRGLVHHVHGAALHNGYSPADVDLSFLPLDHVVPILTCHLKDVYLGIRQLHVRTGYVLRDPLRWLDLLDAHGVTHTWAPNFAFKLVAEALGAASGRQWDLSRVRAFMNAGEQVTLPVVTEFLRLTAPFGVAARAMQPAFGMAEVCTCMTWENDFSPARGALRVAKSSLGGALAVAATDEEGIDFVSLGPPQPGVEVRIAGERNETLPERMIGRLQIRGAVVTPGYLLNDEANREAFPGEGWLDSGDLGFMDQRRLFVTGRKKEMIVVRGANFYCHEIEDVVGRVPGTLPTFVAACAVEDAGTGTESVAIFFVPKEPGIDAAQLRSIRGAVARELGVLPRFVLPLEKAAFPKTTSGKIQRTDLKKRLAAGGFDALVAEVDLALDNELAIPEWFHRWGLRAAPAPSESGASGAGRGASSLDVGSPLGTDSAPSGTELAARLLSLRDAARQACAEGRELVVLTRGAIAARRGELPRPDQTAYLGLVATLGDEYEGLRARIVDVDDSVPPAALEAELRAPSAEPVVALRGERRWVRRLERSTPRLTPGAARTSPIERGGLYLVTGGLGGVGSLLASELLVHYGVKLLITGRADVADDVLPQTSGLAEARSAEERRLTLARLRAQGEVLFERADVADSVAMEAAIRRAEAQLARKLAGVFHLAGSFPARLLAEETPESFAEVLAPKLGGGQCLDALVPDDRLFVGLTSVYGHFGGTATGAYAAASSALDGLLAARRARGLRRTFTLSCSSFRGLGMSRGFAYEASAEALGYVSLDSARAMTSLFAVLSGEPGEVLIGLDGSKANVERFGGGPPALAFPLVVFCTGSGPAPRLSLRDRLGTLAPIESVLVATLPESGSVPRAGGAAVETAPRTPTEQVIAGVWREVLKLSTVDIDTSFFALGGQSILLLRVLERLRALTGVELAVVELFRYPTVRGLAALIDGGRRPETQDKTARLEARAEKQREAARARAASRPRGAR